MPSGWRGAVQPAYYFRMWLRAPRTWWMIGSMLLLCLTQVRQGWLYQLRDEALYPLEIITYHFYGGFNLMMSSSIFLLGCSEIPRRVSWQQQSLIRSSRRAWLFGHIGQCLLMVCVTVGFMIAVTLLGSLGHIRPGVGWSDLEKIERMEILPWDSIMPLFLVQSTSPWQGAAMTVLPVMLFWLTMLLIILLFGMTSRPHLGLLICAFAVLSYVCMMSEDDWLRYFALFRYTRLSGMDLEAYGLSYFGKVMMGYGMLDFGLIAAMTAMVKRTDFTFGSDI